MKTRRVAPLALLTLLATSPATAEESLGIGTNRMGVYDISAGSQAKPDTGTRPVLKVSQTRENTTYDDPDCQESASGSLFDASCAATMSVMATNTPQSTWQVVGLDVLAWSTSSSRHTDPRSTNEQPRSTGDVIAMHARGVKPTGEGTATGTFTSGVLIGDTDPSGAHPKNRALGMEVFVGNYSGKDCGYHPDVSIPGCMGLFVGAAGTEGTTRGGGMFLWEGHERFQYGYACGGKSIGPDGAACFDDWSNGPNILRAGGTRQVGINLLAARIPSGAAIALPSGTGIVWHDPKAPAPVWLKVDTGTGEMWLNARSVRIDHLGGHGTAQLCVDAEGRMFRGNPGC